MQSEISGNMQTETNNALLLSIAGELSSAAVKMGNEATQEQILGVMEKCLKVLSGNEAELLLTLTCQAMEMNRHPDVTDRKSVV